MKPADDDRAAGRPDGDPFSDRRSWVPPPSEEWQRAHGWTMGEPPNAAELLVGEPADDEKSIPTREHVVVDYLPRGGVTELIGPPGAGKSQLAVAWSVAVALGRDFGGFKPKRPMRVALFNIEDDISEQQRRVAAALRFFGARKSDLARLIRGPVRGGVAERWAR